MLEIEGRQMPRDTAAEPLGGKHEGKPPRKRPRMLGLVLIGILIGAVALGVSGIWSRHENEAKLTQWTKAQAIPTVAVVSPKRGAKDQELILPGDIEAYYEAPIYARVPGYLKMWYKDIGAHVKAGEQSHKNTSHTGSESKSEGEHTRGGTHEQHVKAGQQSHKNT